MNPSGGELLVPGRNGKWETAPNILVKKAESKMRGTRDTLKRKLGDVQYQALIGPFKTLIHKQMLKDNKGPVETANWFIEAFHRKKKLTPFKHAAAISAAYELLEAKA